MPLRPRVLSRPPPPRTSFAASGATIAARTRASFSPGGLRVQFDPTNSRVERASNLALPRKEESPKADAQARVRNELAPLIGKDVTLTLGEKADKPKDAAMWPGAGRV